MARMLTVLNDYDPITHYMYEWSKPVIDAAQKKGIKTDCVEGRNVTTEQISSRIAKLNPSFLLLNGHGDDNTFYGYEGRTAIGLREAAMLGSRVVFSRACCCANGLGKHATEKAGCKSFIGYEFEFVNVRQTNKELTPLEDEISRPIWETSNAVPLALIKGATVSDSVEASHQKARKEIARLLFPGEIGAIEALKAVIANDSSLVAHGNNSATI